MRAFRIFILLFVCLLSGCVHHRAHRELMNPIEIPHQTEVTRVLPYFDKVYVKVPVNVTLRTQQRSSRVVLKGNSVDIPLIYTTVRNKTLFVTLGSVKPHVSKKKIQYGPIDIMIDMGTIHSFAYRGKGKVTGQIQSNDMNIWIKNSRQTTFSGNINLHHLTVAGPGVTQIKDIKSDHLVIDLYGNPKVELEGVAALSALNIEGSPMFSFYWVNSPNLVIRAPKGYGKIKLAGIVDRLDVDISGKSYLDATYIRARETFVKTRGHALAKIATTERQHTLAKDSSDIYFYNLPSDKTDFMGKNGAVLDMRPWNLQLEQVYTQYNK